MKEMDPIQMNEKAIDFRPSIPALQILFFILVLAALILGLTIITMGVRTIADLSNFMNNFAEIVISLLKILSALLILILIVLFSYWLLREDSTDVQPFEIGICGSEYRGRPVSDLLISELQRICRIYEMKIDPILPQLSIQPTKAEFKNRELLLFPFIPKSESPSYHVGSVNVSSGPIAISMGQLFLALKYYLGHPGNTIAGSLQRYGSKVVLVAWMGPKKNLSWMVERETEDIPALIRDLAYNIAKYISKNRIAAKTWQGFKYITESRYLYCVYVLAGEDKYLEESKDNCLEALRFEKDNEDLIEFIYNISIVYHNKMDYKKAEFLFEKIGSLELKTDSAKTWFINAASLHYLGRYENARLSYQKAIEIKLDYAEPWYGLGRLLSYYQNDYCKAIQAYEKALLSKSDFIEAYIAKGDAMMALRRYDKASEAYGMAKERNPDYPRIWYYQARALDKYGAYLSDEYRIDESRSAYKEAIKFYNQALTRDREILNYLAAKSSVLNRLEEYDESIITCDEAIKLDPDYPEAWDSKSVALYKSGKKEDAYKSFCRAGLSYKNRGQYSKAVQAYDKAIQINPNIIDAYIGKGNLLSAQYRYINAKEAYDEAIKIAPDCAQCWCYGGRALSNEGDHLRIISQFVEANKMFEEAIKYYDNAIKHMPKSAHFLAAKSYALNRLSKYEDSIDACDKAIEIDPDYPQAWDNKSFALNKSGREDNASDAFYKAGLAHKKRGEHVIAIHWSSVKT
jgi:tetratricopeptide (TPR) repeat protein